jgi:hypothetical protein
MFDRYAATMALRALIHPRRMTVAKEPDNVLAPAGDTDGVPGRPEIQEISPIIMWDKGTIVDNEVDLFDFRPRPEADVEVEAESPDPKDSSAAGSALAAIYETVKTPNVDLRHETESPASAEKDGGEPNPSENGTPTSSTTPETKTGSDEPPA